MNGDVQGDILTALEQYLRSLSPSEWDALTAKVRDIAPALDAQIAGDQQVIASLNAQIAALESVIPGLIASIEAAQQSRDAVSTIAFKQELHRVQTEAQRLKDEFEARLKSNMSPSDERN